MWFLNVLWCIYDHGTTLKCMYSSDLLVYIVILSFHGILIKALKFRDTPMYQFYMCTSPAYEHRVYVKHPHMSRYLIESWLFYYICHVKVNVWSIDTWSSDGGSTESKGRDHVRPYMYFCMGVLVSLLYPSCFTTKVSCTCFSPYLILVRALYPS